MARNQIIPTITKNIDFLERKLSQLINEIREQFTKKYFANEKFPNQHIC